MRICSCYSCQDGNRIVLRGNINKSMLRHFKKVHGPQIAPGIFAQCDDVAVKFIDKKSRRKSK